MTHCNQRGFPASLFSDKLQQKVAQPLNGPVESEQHVCQQGDGGTCEWPDSPQGLTATNVPVCQALMGNNGCGGTTAVGLAAGDWAGGIGVTSSDGSLHPWTDKKKLRQSVCRQSVGVESDDIAKWFHTERWGLKLLAMTEWLFPNYYFSIDVKPRGQGQMWRRIFHLNNFVERALHEEPETLSYSVSTAVWIISLLTMLILFIAELEHVWRANCQQGPAENCLCSGLRRLFVLWEHSECCRSTQPVAGYHLLALVNFTQTVVKCFKWKLWDVSNFLFHHHFSSHQRLVLCPSRQFKRFQLSTKHSMWVVSHLTSTKVGCAHMTFIFLLFLMKRSWRTLQLLCHKKLLFSEKKQPPTGSPPSFYSSSITFILSYTILSTLI